MDLIALTQLAADWRKRAAYLREYGDPNLARLWDFAAVELGEALRQCGDSTLSLTEASRESGYSTDHLGNLVRSGDIPNAGRPNAPRIRREDLPVKRPNGPGRPSRAQALPSRADIRRIAHSTKEET